MYSSRMTVPILATRGCPYQCTYCSAPNMWLPRWIPRDPVKVVDEIEGYVKRYGAGNFPFQDLTAIIQKDWIKAFCEELIRRKLNVLWQLPTGTRSEAIDPEVANLLREAGMTSMAYAPESGSDHTRRLIKKKMTAPKLFQSIDAAAGAGLNVTVFLVIGFPHDRPEHLAENLPFIDELANHGVNDIGVGYYMALPGTELFHSLYDAGRIKIDREYFRHILDALAPIPLQTYCSALSRRDLAYWKFKMYRRFYGAKKRNGEDGLFASIRRAVSGLFHSDDHATKLETVVRNAMTSLHRDHPRHVQFALHEQGRRTRHVRVLGCDLPPRARTKNRQRRGQASAFGSLRTASRQRDSGPCPGTRYRPYHRCPGASLVSPPFALPSHRSPDKLSLARPATRVNSPLTQVFRCRQPLEIHCELFVVNLSRDVFGAI